MSFLFRFHSLLKLRRHKVATEKQKLHTLLQEEQAIQDTVDYLTKTLTEIGHKADNQQQTCLNIIRNNYQYIHNKQHTLLELHETLSAAKEATKKQKRTLLDANRNVKVLEKLETREKLKYYKIQQDEERKKLNEIATLMYNRTNETWIQRKQD